MRMRGYLRMQAPAQSRLLLPRLCAAALLCLDPGLAFYVCAPELITRQNAALRLRRQMQPVGCYSPRPLLYPVRSQSGVSRRLPPLPSYGLPLALRSD